MTTLCELADLVPLLVLVLLLARLVLDWVAVLARHWRPTGALLVVSELVFSTTDPPLKAMRKVVPPLRLGSVSIDMAFLVLLLGVSVLRAVL